MSPSWARGWPDWPQPGPYLLVDDLSIVFIALNTLVGFTTSVFSASYIGHELAKRAAFGHPIGLVYRVTARRVDASIYSIGDVDVSEIARRYGGGGHRNASGFSVGLAEWLESFC